MVFFGVLWYFWFSRRFFCFLKTFGKTNKQKKQTHIQTQGAQGPSERWESKAAGEDRERRQGERGDTRRTGTERARGEPQGRTEREDAGEEGETQGEQGLASEGAGKGPQGRTERRQGGGGGGDTRMETQEGGGDTKLGKVGKMMPNDSLQNVGQLGKVGKH